jgi:lipopolysaccharide/colanic/teichoic acid biosynthesis glycosyltransferase
LLDRNEVDGPMFKIKDDPRKTKVGRIIRKLSIDEMPQFWNVLKGEMSIVGPRPALPTEVARYRDWHRERLRVKPGITGLWQISGRSELTFDEMVLLDVYYIENWSPSLDVKIMLRTIPYVLSGRGAY